MSHSVRINREIRARRVRTIDGEGKQLGILSIEEALELAEKSSLDLVAVAPDADPPVCRIMDYGKYRYEQTKKTKEARKKQHAAKIKEIKMRPNIEDHDYQVKLRKLHGFLGKGHKVKLTMVFRGRELSHMEFGTMLLEKIEKDIEGIGAVEMRPKRLGRNLCVVYGPTKTH